MDMNEIKKDLKEQADYLDAAMDEQQDIKDSYSKSYVNAMRKRDEAEKRGDDEGVAKAEREADFWQDSMCDSDYEMSLLEVEYDGVQKVAHGYGLMIDDYGNVVDSPYHYTNEDVDIILANLFGDDNEHNDDINTDSIDISNIFGDDKEAKSND